MKILILGGSLFLGRHIVEVAIAKDHEVTLFNRGQTNPDLFPHLEKLHGNRDGNLDALAGKRWDAVIDTCGYVPRIVQASVARLANQAKHYTFISSLSVFADFKELNQDETAPVATLPDTTIEKVTGETFGALKALCELMVETKWPDSPLIIRPGLIVGPYDVSDRFAYWVHRIAQGGEVLVPQDFDTDFIDVRDLAEWILQMVEANKTGIYNATGYPQKMSSFIEKCRQVSQSDCSFTWVDEQFLLENDVAPWSELPLWLPMSTGEFAGFAHISIEKAVRDGLTFRPVTQTVADTLAWLKTRDSAHQWRAGLKQERESQLLQLWNQKSG